jgi:hypothetical protein
MPLRARIVHPALVITADPIYAAVLILVQERKILLA